MSRNFFSPLVQVRSTIALRAGGGAADVDAGSVIGEASILTTLARKAQDRLGITKAYRESRRLLSVMGVAVQADGSVQTNNDGTIHNNAGASTAAARLLALRHNEIVKASNDAMAMFDTELRKMVEAGEEMGVAAKIAMESARAMVRARMHRIDLEYPTSLSTAISHAAAAKLKNASNIDIGDF